MARMAQAGPYAATPRSALMGYFEQPSPPLELATVHALEIAVQPSRMK